MKTGRNKLSWEARNSAFCSSAGLRRWRSALCARHFCGARCSPQDRLRKRRRRIPAERHCPENGQTAGRRKLTRSAPTSLNPFLKSLHAPLSAHHPPRFLRADTIKHGLGAIYRDIHCRIGHGVIRIAVGVSALEQMRHDVSMPVFERKKLTIPSLQLMSSAAGGPRHCASRPETNSTRSSKWWLGAELAPDPQTSALFLRKSLQLGNQKFCTSTPLGIQYANTGGSTGGARTAVPLPGGRLNSISWRTCVADQRSWIGQNKNPVPTAPEPAKYNPEDAIRRA